MQKWIVGSIGAVAGGIVLMFALAPLREISTEIEIAAPPSQVWAVLADTKAYPEWNPEIAALNGAWVVGGRLENREGYGPDQQVFWPLVMVAQPGVELRWAGRIGVPRLFDVEHYFLLRAVDGGTRFVQGEKFHGVALWFFDVRQLLVQFEAMNMALKARAEAQVKNGI